MKAIIVLAGFVAMATAAGHTFDHCPNMINKIPEAINVNEVLGHWFYIRKGPVVETKKSGTFDCMSVTLWKEYKGPENEMKYLHHVRKDGKTHISKSNTFELQPSEKEGTYSNNFTASKSVHLPHGAELHIDIQEKLVETDNGKSWSLWATCIKKEGTNSTIVWSVMSRVPHMDPMVEQILVEKTGTLGGVTPSQLRGVHQAHCH